MQCIDFVTQAPQRIIFKPFNNIAARSIENDIIYADAVFSNNPNICARQIGVTLPTGR
jgi:hypothetical protein